MEIRYRSIDSVSQLWDTVDELDSVLKEEASQRGVHFSEVPLWYRGHPRDTYQLLPSLLRLPNTTNSERHLYELYQAFKPELSHWEILFHMQHYFVPTRLLDWTTDLSTALYFAVNSDECRNPSLFILQPCILNNYTLDPNEAKPFLPGAQDDRYLDTYPYSRHHKHPLAILPPIKNDRVRAQNGVFTVHGTRSAPIEMQCPCAVAKIILKIPRAGIGQLRRLGRRARDVFPDETGLAITLKEQFGLKPIPENVIEATLLRIWQKDRTSLEEGRDEVWTQGISGCVVDDRYLERSETKTLQDWLAEDQAPFAIVTGGAASGKTNFLVNLVLLDKYYEKRPVLFFHLAEFKTGRGSLISFLAEFLRLHSFNQQQIDERALKTMISDGRILLVLDGLDELARIQGEDSVTAVAHEISLLTNSGSNGPKVIIACRDHIVHRLRDRNAFSELEPREFALGPVPIPVLERHLAAVLQGVNISTPALEVVAAVPLFYGVLTSTASSMTPRADLATKGDLWRTWLDMACAGPGFADDRRSLLAKLGAVATRMLRKRDDYIDECDLDGMDPYGSQGGAQFRHLVESLTSRDSGRCPVFVQESNNKWRFFHQAIREYTLADNIHFGLHNPIDTSVLSEASLDYESAETYRYLQDLLGNGCMETKFFREPGGIDPARWNRFARNYFEALGMLGVGCDAEREIAVRQALWTMQDNRQVRYKTKFNAARCLVRLHPTGPRVYCEWATKSEWPEIEGGQLDVIYGYAARGFHKRDITLGDRPPEVFLQNPEYDDLSDNVSRTLLQTIVNLANVHELHRDGEFLQVNCAHALIRWLHGSSRQILDWANELMRSGRLLCHTRMNLFLALCIHGAKPDNADEILLQGNSPRHLKGNLDRLCGPAVER